MHSFSWHPRTFVAVISGAAFVLLASAACSISTFGGAQSVDWRTVWKANFNGPARSGLVSSYWKYDTGSGIFGNGQVEAMTNSTANIYLDGHGDLDITATIWGSSWRSGRIQATQLFTAPVGGELMVTASIKQPDPKSGLGYSPSFWMLGQGVWPADGEIDIMEDVNGLSEHSAALHCGNTVSRNVDGTFGPCHERTGLSSGLQPCADCQVAYHTYSVIIDRRDRGAEQIRWYLDHREFYSVSESQVGAAAWSKAVDHGFSIILDIAMGGTYPDAQCRCSAPDADTTGGGTMSIRSLAVLEDIPVNS